MNGGQGTIKIKGALEYASDLKGISQDLNSVFEEMKQIVDRLQGTEGWSGDAADQYYQAFNKIAQTFPMFVKNIENFGVHVETSASLYETLNQKYE